MFGACFGCFFCVGDAEAEGDFVLCWKNFLWYVEYFLYICILFKDVLCAGYGLVLMYGIALCLIALRCVWPQRWLVFGHLQEVRE